MAVKRLSVRKIKEVLRLRAQGLSDRAMAHSLKIPRTTVRRYRRLDGHGRRRVGPREGASGAILFMGNVVEPEAP